jgi:hypothetical protein
MALGFNCPGARPRLHSTYGVGCYMSRDWRRTCSICCPPFSATSCNRVTACSTTDLSVSGVTARMRCVMRAFNSARFAIGALNTLSFRYPHSQKSHGLRSGDLGGQAVGKLRLITLVSPKCSVSSLFTGSAMCGGAPSCIKTTPPTPTLSKGWNNVGAQ